MFSEDDFFAPMDSFDSVPAWSNLEFDNELNMHSNDVQEDNNLISHDCMWTGLCENVEHEDLNPSSAITGPVVPIGQVRAQQSLLKPQMSEATLNAVVHGRNANMKTPPLSDDEDSKPTDIQRDLTEVLGRMIDGDDDKDLIDYLKGGQIDHEFNFLNEDFKEVEEEMETKVGIVEPPPVIKQVADEESEQVRMLVEGDHSYYKGASLVQFNTNLGVDTPSDSDFQFKIPKIPVKIPKKTVPLKIPKTTVPFKIPKTTVPLKIPKTKDEIDVVSVNDRMMMSMVDRSKTTNFPTNPSSEDCQHFQQKVQNHFTIGRGGGIKTRMPTRTTRQSTARLVRTLVPKKKAAAEPKGRRNLKQPKAEPARKTPRRRKITTAVLEPSEKRNLHNNMERKRRIDLRTDFDFLKSVVPEIQKKQRAAKVVILRAAAQYCLNLQQTERLNMRKLELELKRKEDLSALLKDARHNLAKAGNYYNICSNDR